METNYGLRDWCRTLARFVEVCQPEVQQALHQLRIERAPNYYTVSAAMKWINKLAEMLGLCAAMEVMDLNETLPKDRQLKEYRKPRWSAKKAPPKPAAISLADQETYLEGLGRWLDVMKQALDAPRGECHPH